MVADVMAAVLHLIKRWYWLGAEDANEGEASWGGVAVTRVGTHLFAPFFGVS